MCVCVYMCIYEAIVHMRLPVSSCMYMHVYACMDMCVCMCMCVYMCIYEAIVHMRLPVSPCIYMHVYALDGYVCMYVCVCVYVYI